jgi:hypothetical protein
MVTLYGSGHQYHHSHLNLIEKELTMKLALITALTCFALGAPAANAGSSWGSISNVPAEDDNILATVYAEQDFLHYNEGQLTFSSFIDGTLSADTEGFDWNNKAVIRAGGKLQYAIGNSGHVALRFGGALEHRFKSGDTDAAPFIAAEYWFGWGYGTQFPGSTWGVVGNTSPSEKGNVIAMVNLEQGVFAQSVGSGTLIPFVEARLSRDTDKYDWNNKNQFGVGVKYRHPMGKNGSFDVGIKYQHEDRIRSGTTDQGVVIFAGYWLGW